MHGGYTVCMSNHGNNPRPESHDIITLRVVAYGVQNSWITCMAYAIVEGGYKVL